jgi:hypothetical protein
MAKRYKRVDKSGKSYLFYLYLFMHSGVQHEFHFRWCSFRLRILWKGSHMEQELLILMAKRYKRVDKSGKSKMDRQYIGQKIPKG